MNSKLPLGAQNRSRNQCPNTHNEVLKPFSSPVKLALHKQDYDAYGEKREMTKAQVDRLWAEATTLLQEREPEQGWMAQGGLYHSSYR